jgi:hypothetical protein
VERYSIAWLKVMYTMSWVSLRLPKSPCQFEWRGSESPDYCIRLKNRTVTEKVKRYEGATPFSEMLPHKALLESTTELPQRTSPQSVLS